MSALHGHVQPHRAAIRVHADRRGWAVLDVDGRPVGFPVEIAYKLADRLVEVAEGIERGDHKHKSV